MTFIPAQPGEQRSTSWIRDDGKRWYQIATKNVGGDWLIASSGDLGEAKRQAQEHKARVEKALKESHV